MKKANKKILLYVFLMGVFIGVSAGICYVVS